MTNTVVRICLMVILVAAVALSQPNNSIVGSWIQADQGARWTFRADGTGFMEQTNATARFNWQVQGETLQVSTAGTSVPYRVVKFDGQTLVIRNDQVAREYELRREG